MARAKKKLSFAKQLEKIVKEIPEEQRVFGEKPKLNGWPAR